MKAGFDIDCPLSLDEADGSSGAIWAVWRKVQKRATLQYAVICQGRQFLKYWTKWKQKRKNRTRIRKKVTVSKDLL